MSQISPPIRILLVCVVAFMAAWMLFLRPKDDAGTPVAAAPSPAATPRPVAAGGNKANSFAGKAVEKSNEATAAQDAQAEQLAGGAGDSADTAPAATGTAPATATTPSVTATGAPADAVLPSKAALARVPKDVRHAITHHKIIVLSVLTPKGTDDRLVRKELRTVDRLHGRVFVRWVPVAKVARYAAIMRGVDLQQTPTTVVIGFDLTATALIGWVDSETIDQSVVDAIRNSGKLFTSTYLRDVDAVCRTVPLALRDTEISTPASFSSYTVLQASYLSGAKRKFAQLDAPARLRGFDRAVQADLGFLTTTLASWHAALGKTPSAAKLSSTLHYGKTYDHRAKALTQRMDAHDVIGCGTRG